MPPKVYHIIFILTFLLFGCAPDNQYRWIETEDGYKLWLPIDNSIDSYSWEGETVDLVGHGEGTLTAKKNGKIIQRANVSLYYGTINRNGIINVSEHEQYIGEVSSKRYNGFGVLIKNSGVFIGNFENGNANGMCSYFKNGSLKYKGQWKEHKFHGNGILYSDGDSTIGVWGNGKLLSAKTTQHTQYGRYSGDIKNNLPNGEGTMNYNNGWIYEGEWDDGIWNGYGELTTSDFLYSGYWEQGKPNGEGAVSYAAGGYYDGTWKNGERDGWGDSYNEDGTYYIGEWENNEYHGHGSYYFADDIYYEGQWENGLQNGIGVYSSIEFTYVGEWEEGWINGEGRIDYKNGDYYEGHFVENKRYGLGFYQFHEGNSYEGEFVDDVFNGLGRFYFLDGSLYEGEFLNGKICGDGTYYYKDGNETVAITANWDGSMSFPETASILFSNGDIYEGEIINGVPTENGTWYPAKDSWLHDKLVTTNDCYKLHKETIDKAVLITSVSLTVVTLAAAEIATMGTATPAVAATLTTIANVTNVATEVINAADIAVTVSSAAFDEDWNGVAKEVVINVVFIAAPHGKKLLTSKPVRKSAEKISKSATANVVRKSIISISQSKPFKKVSTIVIEKSGEIKNVFVSSTKKNLERFKNSKYGKRLVQKQSARNLRNVEKIIEKFAKKLNLNEKLKAHLLNDIKLDGELGDLIRNNPEFNINRWLNTRRKVDKSLIAKGAKNRQYAGKNFYFHPSLNKNVQNYLRKNGKFSGYTKKQLLELDRLFSNGVPYTKKGFPDFIAAGACKLDESGKLIKITMPNGTFTGNREKDFEIARKQAEKLFGSKIHEEGYIWHHLEGSPAAMVLVKTECHEICKHAGGHSLAKNNLLK